MCRVGKRLSVILTVFLVFCAIFGSSRAFAASAGIVPGKSALSKDSVVWFGGASETKPLSDGWLVLKTEEDSALLIANGTQFGLVKFNNSGEGIANNWEISDVKKACVNLYENWPSAIEKNNIKTTTIQDDQSERYNIAPCQIENEHLYLISYHELLTLFGTDPEKYYIYDGGGASYSWWLRNPSRSDRLFAAWVSSEDYGGEVNNMQVDNNAFLRPAFSLNLSDILFMTPAEGGKPNSSQLLPVTAADTEGAAKGWKLTLKDSSRTFAAAEKSVSAKVGGTVSIPYTGAVPGENEYISLMLVDGEDITYYASVKAEAADGTAEFTLPEELGLGSYTAKIFNEKKMPDRMSDYAGEPQDITLNVKKEIQAKVTFKVAGGSWNDGTAADQTVTLSGVEGETLKLAANQIPAVGNKPAAGYAAGNWDTVPSADAEIAKDVTYTYTYQKEAPAEPKPEPEKTEKESVLLNLTGAISGKKIVAKWNRIEEADMYKVYGSYCDSKNKLLKTIKKNTTTKATFTKLNGKKLNVKAPCKLKVVAYKKVNGKEKAIAKSLVVHFVSKKNAKFTNAKSVKVNKTSVTLTKGKTAKIKATVVLADKKKKSLNSSHGKSIRFASTNKKIATVSQSGKITGKKPGSCTIYVYAFNGCSKKVKVTVK